MIERRPWLREASAPASVALTSGVVARLPESATSLVVCVRTPQAIDLVAVGPRLRAFYKPASALPLYLRFTFRPGAARLFFGLPLHELSERSLTLDEVWGGEADRLRSRIAQGRGSVAATVRAVESALRARLERVRFSEARVALVGRAAEAFDAAEDGEHPQLVHGVARQLGISERGLRQLFADEVGISPKRYARIRRIRRVVASSGRDSWAEVAARSGFYDQAHLNAEFRDLLGVTPRAFVAGDVPVHRGPC